MNALTRNPIAAGVALLVLLLLLFNTFSIVDEKKQAVILRFGIPQRTINAYKPGEVFGRTTQAGVVARLPFLDRIVWVDKRVLDIDLDDQPVLSTDQQRLQVDAYARFRVVDPLKMVVAVGTAEAIPDKIRPLFSSALRNELGRRPFDALLSPERGQLMDNIQASLQRLTSQYGVEIVDVRIKHADLPPGSPLESAYERMRTARQQEALTIQANGLKDAQIIRANASAQAAQIYAAAFGKDPEFYDFYRSMQSYRTTFLTEEKQGSSQIILSPQNGYLRQFMGQR